MTQGCMRHCTAKQLEKSVKPPCQAAPPQLMLGRISSSQVAANTRPTDENRVLIGFFMASAFLVRLFLLCAVVSIAMRYRGAT